MNKISHFRHEYFFLSNFAVTPISEDGIVYPTIEHFFQAMKTLDRDERIQIAQARTPDLAKNLGQRVKLRPDWEKIKDDVMEHALRKKFSNKSFMEKLLKTKPLLLEEGNYWHDNYWGNCTCGRCLRKKGLNKLGKLLMKIRDEEV